ncbi:MAG TPA: phosphate signaling complex protein PhoU [Jiangellaceae bacterium]
MREAYREQLDDITARLVGMTRQAGEQIRTATAALLGADLELAEQVVAADSGMNRAQLEIDEQVLELMATQGPVASELRVVTSALRTTSDAERMGDLAVHVAKVARMRYPDNAVPEELRDTFAAMGRTAEDMAAKAGAVLRSRDLSTAAELAFDDNEMDQLHRSLFQSVLDDSWDRGIEAAVDIALLGRYYERFADHAVEISTNVRYLVTGEIEWADTAPGR